MSRRGRSPAASPPDDLDLVHIHRLSSPPDDGRSIPAPTHPLDDDDLLCEILICLPPLPSSLPRASLVCKRWRRLLKDPAFFRRFRAHHRKPPLLGFFAGFCRPIFFTPTLDPPDRIPAKRLNRFTLSGEGRGHFCGCRHGLALLLGPERPEALVWDPVTGHRRRVPFPPGFHIKRQEVIVRHAAMLCPAGGDGPFKLALLRYSHNGILACLYDSESGVWGDKINTATAHEIDPLSHSVVVGNAFCWRVGDAAVLEFDIQRQSLCVIEKPAEAEAMSSGPDRSFFQVLRTEDGGLGIAMASGRTIQLWERKPCPDRWVLGKNIDLSQLRLLGPREETLVVPLGFDEDNNAIFLRMAHRIVMIQLSSLQSKMLFHDDSRNINYIFPYTSFYDAANVADGEDDGPEMLNDEIDVYEWSLLSARIMCPLLRHLPI